MKKVFIALGVVVLLLAGGVAWLYVNLDRVVKSAIETAGTRALGTQVAVGSVSLDLTAGTATIRDFAVANPQGYAQEDMLRFSELSVALDTQDISTDSIHVFSVVSRDPHVRYESRGGRSNFDEVLSRFDSGEPAQETEDPTSLPRIILDEVRVENIRGTLVDDRLPAAVEVSLGDLELYNLDGRPADLASQIMAPILTQVGRRAAEELIRSATEILGNAEGFRIRVEEGRQRIEEEVDNVLERVGNLLGD